MRDFSNCHRWLSINTATVRRQRGRPWPLEGILEACAAREIRAVALWRDQVAELGLQPTAACLRRLGLEVSGYCSAGAFTFSDRAAREAVRTRNLQALDEACTLGAACLIVVAGGLPGGTGGVACSRDLAGAREQVVAGLAELLAAARVRGMPLAIEPLHPMYAADRACINTLEQALDICDLLDGQTTGAIGVAIDAYHVWWDPKLEAQIVRAGGRRILAFHLCDWLVPTRDLALDRGMMGDGIIDLRQMRRWIEAQGYTGHCEVEIFSETDWWQRDGGETLDTCTERFRRCV